MDNSLSTPIFTFYLYLTEQKVTKIDMGCVSFPTQPKLLQHGWGVFEYHGIGDLLPIGNQSPVCLIANVCDKYMSQQNVLRE